MLTAGSAKETSRIDHVWFYHTSYWYTPFSSYDMVVADIKGNRCLSLPKTLLNFTYPCPLPYLISLGFVIFPFWKAKLNMLFALGHWILSSDCSLNTKKNKRKSYTVVTDIVFVASWRKILFVEERKAEWNRTTIHLHVTAGIDGHRHQHHEETV